MNGKRLTRSRIFVLLVLLSACSPSESQIGTAIAQTDIAKPTATTTPEPAATLTPTPAPTQTFTPTIEPTPTFLYDAFDNPAHDGYINQALWAVHTNSNMAIHQNNGRLAFQASKPGNIGTIWINPTPGVEASLQDYNFIEANFSWEANVRNKVYFGITAIQNWSPRVAYTCDFIITEDLPNLHCSGIDGKETVSPEIIPVVTGQVYALRIEIDPTTATIVVYLDEAVIDTYHPPSPEKWLQGRISFDIHLGADPGSIFTGYADDVRFGSIK